MRRLLDGVWAVGLDSPEYSKSNPFGFWPLSFLLSHSHAPASGRAVGTDSPDYSKSNPLAFARFPSCCPIPMRRPLDGVWAVGLDSPHYLKSNPFGFCLLSFLLSHSHAPASGRRLGCGS